MEHLNEFGGNSVLALLQETHAEAIKTNAVSYEQWLRVRNEHATLLDFLTTLPGALSHDVLVPFGCRALMRGKLVHTNEILVRLGDGWFVKCSARHAADICNRRISLCKDKLEKLEKERDFLLSRQELPVQQEAFGSSEQAEIIETSTAEEEAEWRVRHREKERQYRQKLAEVRQREKKPIIEEEDIWQRLDQLELEEELQEELDRLHAENSDYEEDDDDIDYGEEIEVEDTIDRVTCVNGTNGVILDGANAAQDIVSAGSVTKEHVSRRVSFPDKVIDTEQDDIEAKRRRVSFSDKPKDIDNADSEDTESDEELRIEFLHTPDSGTLPSELHDSNVISCPADIYDHYRHVHGKTSSLKSILKKTANSLEASAQLRPSDEITVVNGTNEAMDESLGEEEVLPPVFGDVVERKVQEPSVQTPVEKRPVSKFKAARQASKR